MRVASRVKKRLRKLGNIRKISNLGEHIAYPHGIFAAVGGQGAHTRKKKTHSLVWLFFTTPKFQQPVQNKLNEQHAFIIMRINYDVSHYSINSIILYTLFSLGGHRTRFTFKQQERVSSFC